jgi:hypothetical protein
MESDSIGMEFGTAYPTSVLRDSLGMLSKIRSEQILNSKYKVRGLASAHFPVHQPRVAGSS